MFIEMPKAGIQVNSVESNKRTPKMPKKPS